MDPSDKDYKDICSKLLYYSAQNSYDDVWACLNMRIDPNFIYSKDIYDTYDEIYKRPALIHGLIHEDYDLTDLLLSFSADPNSIDPLSKKSALIIAILRNNHYLIQLLLSYGANVNMQGNRHGNTPLMVVARKIGQAIQENNDSEIKKAVRCLQEICAYQPDFSLKNNCGKTVWDIAQRYNTTEDMVHYINNASAGRFC
jgi:ankyrin repeat protein